jgi:DNA-binding SARP family transcriptional activator
MLAVVAGAPRGTTRAAEAESTLLAAGAHGYRVALRALRPPERTGSGKPLSIATLGRFAVRRDGHLIAGNEWQSKKARDLLKILVSRRGKPTPRDVLMEALWPEDDPRRVANRLSVALSTLRGRLDPDRRRSPDYFLVTSGGAIGLQPDTVDVDVDAFLETGKDALARHEAGDAEARRGLETAESLYRGDFLEEDMYEDWAVPLREEARALYLEVASALADLSDAAGDLDAAVRYRLRLLERDPYDEHANLGLAETLIRSGRHGEARRAYGRYASRMAEIGVEAAPFPSPRRAGAASV